MCGRYALYGPISRHRQHFGLGDEFDFEDQYNVAPSQVLPVIRSGEGGGRAVIAARWGLLPSWVKDPSAISQPINAKAETARQKPMFRHAYRKSRILVPASGFYEWQARSNGKQAFFIRIRGGEPMGFGGLLERWEGADGIVWSYCILTTEPNELLATIHTRMPVIIRPEGYDAWLNPELTESGIISELVGPYPAELIEAYSVGRAVGNPRAQGAQLVAPLESSAESGS